jgi:hypothetical protein
LIAFLFILLIGRIGKRIVEKTPYHYKFISEILFSFPEAKIIFISRHPLDVYSSFRKRAKLDKNWTELPVEKFCTQYSDCYKWVAWQLKRKPKNIISVQYENLVQDPKAAFSDVCSFIGEDFEEKCLLGDNSKKGPEWDPNVHKNIIKKTKSWRDYITDSESEEIETNLLTIMSEFNYDSCNKNKNK